MKFLSFFSEHLCKDPADLEDDVWTRRFFQTSRHEKAWRDEHAQKHSWHCFTFSSGSQNNHIKNIHILYRLPASTPRSEALSVAPTAVLPRGTHVHQRRLSAWLRSAVRRFNPHSLLHPPTVTAPHPQLSHTVILAPQMLCYPQVWAASPASLAH